jgi:large subunit ribosomal protein L6
MSRVGKAPIQIPSGVTVDIKDGVVSVKGSKGELKTAYNTVISVKIEGDQVIVERPNDEKENRSFHGLTRALIANMIIGVTEGFEKHLEIKGVGYRIATSGKKVTLNLGFSHPIEYQLPEGIEVEIDKENKSLFTVKGIDKQLVGEVAAQLRGYRKPEPYKGKGIRYIGEYVPMKQGKTAAKAAA